MGARVRMLATFARSSVPVDLNARAGSRAVYARAVAGHDPAPVLQQVSVLSKFWGETELVIVDEVSMQLMKLQPLKRTVQGIKSK